jgi:hypothetical protein
MVDLWDELINAVDESGRFDKARFLKRMQEHPCGDLDNLGISYMGIQVMFE